MFNNIFGGIKDGKRQKTLFNNNFVTIVNCFINKQERERRREEENRRDLEARLRRLQELQDEKEEDETGDDTENEDDEEDVNDEEEENEGEQEEEQEEKNDEDDQEEESEDEEEQQNTDDGGGDIDMKGMVDLLKSTVDLAKDSMNRGNERWSAERGMRKGDTIMKSLAEENVFGIQRYSAEANKAVVYNKGKQGVKYAFDPSSEPMMLYIVKHLIDVRLKKMAKKKKKGEVWKLLMDVRDVLDMISAAQIWCDRGLVTAKIFRMWEADPRGDKSMAKVLGDLGMVPMIIQAHSMMEMTGTSNGGNRNGFNKNYGRGGGRGGYRGSGFRGGRFRGRGYRGRAGYNNNSNYNFGGGSRVCWQFQQHGTCTYGNACKFQHAIGDKGGGNVRPQAPKEEEKKEG